MARIRSIKPEFFTDEDIAKLSPLARLAFEGLWCHSDKAGRLEDRPTRLKVLILPYDDVDFGALINEMAAEHFVIRYAVGGRRYLQVRTFGKHQRPRTDEPESEIPPPEGFAPTETDASLHSDSDVSSQTLGKEGKGREGERKGTEEVAPSALRAPSPPAADAVLTFPTIGPQRCWELTQPHVDAWQQQFPNLDVVDQCRRALAWLQANPTKQKTARGMPSFFVRWFMRETDSPRTSRHNGNGAHQTVRADDAGHIPPCKSHAECIAKRLGRSL